MPSVKFFIIKLLCDRIYFIKPTVKSTPTAILIRSRLFRNTFNEMATSGEHVGHALLKAMKKRRQFEILVIDGWTDSRMSVGETLHQSVRLAVSLRRLALRPGDVLALAGRNHTALPLPYYAAIMNGLPVVGLSPSSTFDNIRSVFELTAPKIVFCQNESYDMYKRVSEELGIDLKIVTFDEGEFSLSKLLEVYCDDDPIDTFKPTEFDPSNVYAWLVSTSGSTGVPKVAAIGHHVVINKFIDKDNNSSWPPKLLMNVTSLQWISAYKTILTACIRSGYTLLQTSRPGLPDGDHYVDIINKYRLVDPTTGEDITKPNDIGEAWIQGPGLLFEKYYKNPEETSTVFHEGWYKTGDLMMRDEQDRYYFVERIKFLINYRNQKIMPSELESVIVSHPDVLDVAVTSVPHAEDGQRAVGCVVKRPGSHVTAQHIKDFIANTLPPEKHLHGGVILLEKIPRIYGIVGKVDNRILRDMMESSQSRRKSRLLA